MVSEETSHVKVETKLDGLSAQTIEFPISRHDRFIGRDTSGLVQQLVCESSAVAVPPVRFSGETRIVQEYFDNHMISEPELHSFVQIRDSINSSCQKQFEIVGSHGAGLSSKRDSSHALFLAPRENISYNRRDVLNSLRTAGPLLGWTPEIDPKVSDVVILKLLSNRKLSIIIFTCNGSILIQRTNLMKVYSHLIDPRIPIMLGILRARTLKTVPLAPINHLDLDFFLFLMLWKIMTSKRIWPDLLTSNRVGDMQYWTEHGPGIKGWQTEGSQAHPRLSVSVSLQLVIDALDIEVLPAFNQCPISGRSIIEDSLLSQQIFNSLCVLDFTV